MRFVAILFTLLLRRGVFRIEAGGQLRRMAIARALLREPDILLLDEPTTGLDVENSALVLNTLRRISDHATVVMVSHRSEPLKASDHHLILRDGGWTSSIDHQADEPSNATIAEATSAAAPAPTLNGHEAVGEAPVPITTNGSSHRHASGHRPLDQKVLALSAMGRPIVLNGVDHDEANARILMLSGHRSLARPITALSPTVFGQVTYDPEVVVAMASIEDVNPDGEFSSRRETVLGIDVESDHRARRAAETHTLHATLDDWKPDTVIDLAERAIDSSYDVEVALRFVPDADGGASAEAMAFAQTIRTQLDRSSFSFRMSLVGALPGSLAAERDLQVVEVSTQNTSNQRVINAVIDSIVATYRAAALQTSLNRSAR